MQFAMNDELAKRSQSAEQAAQHARLAAEVENMHRTREAYASGYAEAEAARRVHKFLFRVMLTAQRGQHLYISNNCCAAGCLRVLCTFVRFRRFVSAGSCMTLLKVSGSIWTAPHSRLAGRVRTKPKCRAIFSKRR